MAIYSYTCKQCPLQLLSCFLSLLNVFSFRVWGWWRGPVNWSQCESVFMCQAAHGEQAFTGISLTVLVSTEPWDAAVGKDKSVVWIQCSEIYRYPLFPEFINSFSAAGTVKGFWFCFLSLDHLTHALTRQNLWPLLKCQRHEKSVVCFARFFSLYLALHWWARAILWSGSTVFLRQKGKKNRQARPPVHCSATWSDGNCGEAPHFSPFPFSPGHHALVEPGMVMSLCTLEKTTDLLSSVTWRPIKNLRTGAQTEWLQAM